MILRNCPSRNGRRLSGVVAAVAAGAILAACSNGPGAAVSSPTTGRAEPIPVAAAFYPVAEAVERVGGDRVEVQNLTPPGTGPHDLELQPRQVTELDDAQVVFYLSGGFQPAVEAAVDQLPGSVEKVDVLRGIDLLPVQSQLSGTQGEVDGEELEGGLDPHVWVDPVLQSQIAVTVRDALVAADPQGASDYDAGLAAYRAELGALTDEFTSGLASCRSRVIVTSHRAFAYLSERFDLTQIPIAGISPDEEPDPQSLEAVAAAARDNDVKVVFFEEQVPPDLSETVAREIGATTDALDPVESITQEDLDAGASYSSIMRANLASLESGLGCS